MTNAIRTNYARLAADHGYPALASLVIQFAEACAGRAGHDRERLQSLLRQTSDATTAKALDDLNWNYVNLRQYHATESGSAAIAAAEKANWCKFYTIEGPSKDVAMALAMAGAVTEHAALADSDAERLRQAHLIHIQDAQRFGVKPDPTA